MMKVISTLIVTVFLFVSNFVSEENSTITVTVENVNSNKGKVGFALYNKNGFLKIPLKSKQAKIDKNKSTTTFENVANGEYAVVCYHDKNDNGMMDFDERGIPLEEYGASNNRINPFGPPTYEDAKFVASGEDIKLSIRF